MHMTIATPKGYELPAHVWERVKGLAETSGATYTPYHDPIEAVRGANVVYTDTWVSMGQEAETEQRRAIMRPYQVNAQLVASADKHAVVMHDLPAYRGYEITDEVADSSQSVIFQQAHNRLHAQKAILVRLLTG
jgi:ornithine carbamoyltransferase